MIITLLRFLLTVDEPFAVAAPEAAAGGTDRPAAHDPHGNVLVPPSSIAGNLRHHVHQQSPDLADHLFGPRSTTGEQLRSSPLRILGTVLTRDGEPVTWQHLITRRQTGIDRRRRAADVHTLRSSQLVPPGADIEVFARLDRDQVLTSAEREVLASWVPQVGWGATTGYGHARLDRILSGTLDLDDLYHLSRWLLDGGPDLHRAVATADLVPPPSQERMPPWRTYRFEIVDALHIGSGSSTDRPGHREPGERSNVAALWRRQPSGNPVIEGSTLKGILRSGAEYVLGSLQETLPDGSSRVTPELVDVLFGTPDRQGRLVFHAAEVAGAHIEKRPHVAINRLTSGAHDRHLYSHEVAVGGSFELRISNRGPVPDGTAALIDAVIRDLHDGLIGIGGRTTAGYGTVRLSDPTAYPRPPGDELLRLVEAD